MPILSIFLFLFNLYRPFYVSITQIDYNETNKTLEATIKIFTDDLENCINKESNIKLGLGSSKQFGESDKIIRAYILNHFQLGINQKEYDAEFVGFETELDVTRIYVQWNTPKKIREIQIVNNLLIDCLEDQTNIVHVDFRDLTKSLMLNKSETSGNLEFP